VCCTIRKEGPGEATAAAAAATKEEEAIKREELKHHLMLRAERELILVRIQTVRLSLSLGVSLRHKNKTVLQQFYLINFNNH
jgi:hypothetical protein